MFPPKALDAKENGAVLGTTRILDGMMWYYQYLNLKTSITICRVFPPSRVPWVWNPGTSRWLRTNMDVKSQNTLLLRTAFNFQPDSNTWAHGRTDALNNVIFQTKSDRFIRLMVDSFLTVLFKECSFLDDQSISSNLELREVEKWPFFPRDWEDTHSLTFKKGRVWNRERPWSIREMSYLKQGGREGNNHQHVYRKMVLFCFYIR